MRSVGPTAPVTTERMHALAASGDDTTLARREQARAEAEAALRLRLALLEGQEALGEYWARSGDVSKAIDELGFPLRASPHSASLPYRLGFIMGERAGRLEDALAAYERASKSEPGNGRARSAVARTSSHPRRPDAEVLAAAPDSHAMKVAKGDVYLRRTGSADTLAAVMRTVPAVWDPNGAATYARFTALYVQRRYGEGLAMLDQSTSELTHDVNRYLPTTLMRAQLQEALGERKLARVSYATALSLLRDSLAAHPGDQHIRVNVALALAGLGEKGEAVREAHRAMNLVAASSDVQTVSSVMGIAAEVLAKAGETDDALDLVELLFSMHTGREVTVPYLRVWPGFDPLRSDPRFQALLARFGADSTGRNLSAGGGR